MKNLLLTIAATFAFATFCFAQTAPKADVALETAMQRFINSIQTKNTSVFLSFISPAKGLTVMNTIDQGENGNADRPVLDEKLEYKTLATDFRKKRGVYRNIFAPSPDSPNFYDAFGKNKRKWSLGADNKFMLTDETDGKLSKAIYVKWENQDNRWIVVEVGRPIS